MKILVMVERESKLTEIYETEINTGYELENKFEDDLNYGLELKIKRLGD